MFPALQQGSLCHSSERHIFARIWPPTSTITRVFLTVNPESFRGKRREGARTQRVFSGLASLRLGVFAMEGLFYPRNSTIRAVSPHPPTKRENALAPEERRHYSSSSTDHYTAIKLRSH